MMGSMHSLRLSPSSRRRTRAWVLRHVIAAGLAMLWGAPAASHEADAPLPRAVAEALRAADIPASAVSLWVAPVDANAPRLAHRSNELRPAASVMKLFTTGAALHMLGPAWTWQTDTALGGPLSPDGTLSGPLYLRGSGDPSLRMEQVYLMLMRWRAAGLRHIHGDIVIDRQAFAIPEHDPWAFDGQGLRPYNAGPDALLLNHQAITLHFAPDAARPGQISVAMAPALAGVTLDAQLTPDATRPCGDWRTALTLLMRDGIGTTARGISPRQLQIRGAYPLSCGTQTWPALWQSNSGLDFTARLLTQTWLDLGGTLDGQVRPGTWPVGLAPWQTWTSEPLPLVVRDINKFSNNVMARQLFLTLGSPHAANLEQARDAVARTVWEATHSTLAPSPCDPAHLVLDNGSGLSRTEGSSAACLGAWLQALWVSPHMPDLMASLPITGVDGTARRWQGAPGHAHIKTGSLAGVSAMAGYVDGVSGRRHVVVGIVQHPQASAARTVLDALLNWARQDP